MLTVKDLYSLQLPPKAFVQLSPTMLLNASQGIKEQSRRHFSGAHHDKS